MLKLGTSHKTPLCLDVLHGFLLMHCIAALERRKTCADTHLERTLCVMALDANSALRLQAQAQSKHLALVSSKRSSMDSQAMRLLQQPHRLSRHFDIPSTFDTAHRTLHIVECTR